MNYIAPIEDIRFAMQISGALDALLKPDEGGVTLDLIDSILTEGARFFEEKVAPGNRSADLQGAKLQEGRVHVPAEIATAWSEYAGGGWVGMHAPEAFGGHGLPKVISA